MLFSQKGVAFTPESIETIRHYSEAMRRINCLLDCSACFDKDGKMIVGFGGRYAPEPLFIWDQLEDVVLYWSADADVFETLRDNYYMEVLEGHRTQAIKRATA